MMPPRPSRRKATKEEADDLKAKLEEAGVARSTSSKASPFKALAAGSASTPRSLHLGVRRVL